MKTINPKFKIYNWYIMVYAAVFVGLDCCYYYKFNLYNIYITIIIGFAILCIFANWVSILTVYDDIIKIKYPFRFTNKVINIDISDIESVRYNVMASKASSEFIKFHLKNGKFIKVNLQSLKTKYRYPMLVHIQSKGVVVEVSGTENNSIEDLRH